MKHKCPHCGCEFAEAILFDSKPTDEEIAREAGDKLRDWIWEAFGLRVGQPMSVAKMDSIICSAIKKAKE